MSCECEDLLKALINTLGYDIKKTCVNDEEIRAKIRHNATMSYDPFMFMGLSTPAPRYKYELIKQEENCGEKLV